MRFLAYLSNTLIENGSGFKIPESIQNIQKRIQQILNLKENIPFLNSNNPIGKAFINLLVRLQSLIVELHTGLLSPSTIISTRALMVAVDGCIDAVRVLSSVNPYLPPILLQPLLLILEIMSKFLKYETKQ